MEKENELYASHGMHMVKAHQLPVIESLVCSHWTKNPVKTSLTSQHTPAMVAIHDQYFNNHNFTQKSS